MYIKYPASGIITAAIMPTAAMIRRSANFCQASHTSAGSASAPCGRASTAIAQATTAGQIFFSSMKRNAATIAARNIDSAYTALKNKLVGKTIYRIVAFTALSVLMNFEASLRKKYKKSAAQMLEIKKPESTLFPVMNVNVRIAIGYA